MLWNQKCIAAAAACGAALGYLLGRAAGAREMWRLRRRADENQYLAEFCKKACTAKRELSALLEKIPEERLWIHGREKDAQWLKTTLNSPRIVSSSEEAGAVLSFDPTAEYPGKRVYWLSDLIGGED